MVDGVLSERRRVWTRSWEQDNGRKQGVFRPRRLSIDESQYIAFGITVRLSEVTLALYPPDSKTRDTYSYIEKLPPTAKQQQQQSGGSSSSNGVSRQPTPPSAGPVIGSMGAPLVAITFRRVGYDYFMRLHDMSNLITIGDITGYCDGLGIASTTAIGRGGSPMILGSPTPGPNTIQRPRLSPQDCRDLFQQLDVDQDGRVSRMELQRLCRKDAKVRLALGLQPRTRAQEDSGGGGGGASPNRRGSWQSTSSSSPGRSPTIDNDMIEELFNELDQDGSGDIDLEEVSTRQQHSPLTTHHHSPLPPLPSLQQFERVFKGGVRLIGSSGEAVFSALPAEPRLHMAERRWPRSSRDPSAKLASQEDFLQVRLSGFEPGSPRYERCGGLLALHVELATLSIHLTPKTLLPVGNYALSVAAGMGQMGRQFLSEVNPPDELDQITARHVAIRRAPAKRPI